ncbi:MAG: glycosyltransferase family 39 protein [Candidatus Omnitrophota bacterium]|jgi:hypothetical protein
MYLKDKKQRINFLLLSTLLLGAALRIYNLGKNSLWADEAGFIIFKSGNLLSSLRYILRGLLRGELDPCHHGYRIFSTVWSSFSSNEFMLRLSSVIFGVISIFYIYKLGKILFSKEVGLISAFILSISPFHIYYSQEFRMYTLITLLTIATAYCLKKFLESGKKEFLFGYVITHAFNIWLHMITVLVLIAENIFFVCYYNRYRNLLRKWLKAHLIILLFVMPEIIFLVLHLKNNPIRGVLSSTISTVSVLGHISPIIPLYSLKNFSAGYNVGLTIWLPIFILFVVLFIFGIIKTKTRQELNLCLFGLFIPIIILYLFQKYLYADRFLIPSSIFFYLIVANGLYYLKKPLFIFTLIVISCLYLPPLSNYYKGYLPCPLEQRIAVHYKRPHREAASFVLKNYQKGDIIFHTDPNTALPFEYYFNLYFQENKNKKTKFARNQIRLILRFSKNNTEPLPYDFWTRGRFRDLSDIVSVKNHKRVWLVFSAREFTEANQPGSPERRIVAWMDKHYIKKDVKEFKRIIVLLYTSPDKEIN